jgi:hypothetical protein
MNPQTRKLLIQRLVKPIGVIGSDFERFAELVLDHTLSTPLEHSGLNPLGFPVSRVLDSSSADGAIVAEYSAEDHYFAKEMPKAEKDLTHALSRRPNAKLVLLCQLSLIALRSRRRSARRRWRSLRCKDARCGSGAPITAKTTTS